MTAFDRLGKAYLAFARSEPAYYSAMFEAGIPLDTKPGAARDRRRRLCGVARLRPSGWPRPLPAPKRPPALMMALHIWSTTHGIASLFGRGDAGRRTLPMSAEELLEAAVLIYLRGLGLPDGPPPLSAIISTADHSEVGAARLPDPATRLDSRVNLP